MPDDALLAETNRLLSRVLQIHEEQRAESATALAQMQERTARLKADSEAAMAERLKREDLPPEGRTGTSEEWEGRREAATRRTEETIVALRDRDEAYKAEVLAELQIQSDLLRRIAERLER